MRPLLARLAAAAGELPRVARLGLLAALLAGAALRLAYPRDIEYKEDERWMTQRAVRGPVPMIGMPSGAGLRNPGLSVWAFVGLARLTGADGPVELARRVQALNVLALAMVVLGALLLVRPEEREPWLWAGALAAVNPLAVLLHRKIWAQSLLPALSAAFVLAWMRRDRRAAAFLWGLVGALLGQVHMSGFFLAAAVALWTLLAERRGAAARRARWGAWALGSAVGAVGLIPWLLYLASPEAAGASRARLANVLLPRVWAYWVGDPLGLHLGYSLGPAFREFATRPAALLAHALIGASALVLGWLALRALPRTRAGWKAALLGDASESALLTRAALVGFGVLLTLSGAWVARHYLIVTFPLEWVWLAGAALAGAAAAGRRRLARGALCALWAAHLALSVDVLRWIHLRGGSSRGDYGLSYARQAQLRQILRQQRERGAAPADAPAPRR